MESLDLLFYMNMTCADCTDLGPPPDSILNIPPPPLPAFLQRTNHSCTEQCEWGDGPAVEYVELPRQGPTVQESWILIPIASCIGVLLLGSLLALVLFKCRSRRNGKGILSLDGPTLGTKGVKGCEAVLYPSPALAPDSRVLWATITPRGTTQHFTGPPQYGATLTISPPVPQAIQPVSFDNSSFVDTDDPLSFPLSDLGAEGSPKRSATLVSPGPRPRVSSPTRIEHPNLPPLNLHIHHKSLRRATLTRRDSDTSNVVQSATPVIL